MISKVVPLVLLVVAVVHARDAVEEDTLPTGMEGLWTTRPDSTVLGPFAGNLSVQFSRVGGGDPSKPDWVVLQSFMPDSMLPDSWQQFWVFRNLSMLYCAILPNFFSTTIPEPIVMPFVVNNYTSTSIQFCSIPAYGGCDDARWTMTLSDDHTYIHSLLTMPSPVKHLDAILVRDTNKSHTVPVPTPPVDPGCYLFPPHDTAAVAERMTANSSSLDMMKGEQQQQQHQQQRVTERVQGGGGGGIVPPHLAHGKIGSGCPFASHHHPISDDDDIRVNLDTPTLTHCYIFNDALDVRVRWTHNTSTQTLHVSVSAPTPDEYTWVALGFMPHNLGMQGADIVLAYPATAAGNTGCVRTMYAEEFVGTPIESVPGNFTITDASVVRIGGLTTLSFSRAFDTGHTAIPSVDVGHVPEQEFTLMWGMGGGASAALKDCSAQSVPHYHSNKRGMRIIAWAEPSTVLPDFVKC